MAGDTVDVRHDQRGEPIKFHWNQIVDLCAGAQDDTAVERREDDLRSRLGIAQRNWKQLGPTACALLLYSGRLSSSALGAACAYGVQFELAIDPRDRGRLARDGWELDTHRIRVKEIAKRLDQLAGISVRYADDPVRLQSERNRLEEVWRIPSTRHPRAERS